MEAAEQKVIDNLYWVAREMEHVSNGRLALVFDESDNDFALFHTPTSQLVSKKFSTYLHEWDGELSNAYVEFLLSVLDPLREEEPIAFATAVKRLGEENIASSFGEIRSGWEETIEFYYAPFRLCGIFDIIE